MLREFFVLLEFRLIFLNEYVVEMKQALGVHNATESVVREADGCGRTHDAFPRVRT